MTKSNPFEDQHTKYENSSEEINIGDIVVYGEDETFGAPNGDPQTPLTVGREYEVLKVSDDGKEITIKDNDNVSVKVNTYHFKLKK